MLSYGPTGRYFVEGKTISYVSSGREIVRLAEKKKQGRWHTPLVVGNPDFDLNLGVLNATNPIIASHLDSVGVGFEVAPTRGLSPRLSCRQIQAIAGNG